MVCVILERISGYKTSSETIASRYMYLKLVMVFRVLLFPLDLPLDAVGAVYHQFDLLSTDLHFIPWVLLFSELEQLCIGKTQIGDISFAYANLSIMVFQSIKHDPSRKILKRMGDQLHSSLTPTVLRNHSPVLPFIWTALVALS